MAAADFIIDICRNNPHILIFLTLAIGYALGKMKYRGFGLGTTVWVLLVALALGQIGITVPALLKTLAFALFSFCIGYKVGPQFFAALKREGLSYIWLTLVIDLTCLLGAIGLGTLLQLDPGTTAGLFAGSDTQSASLGTAEGAVAQLPVSDAQRSALDTNVVVAYAITYIFGTAGGILFFKIAPALLRINLRDEARKLEERMSGGLAPAEKPGLFSWTRELEIRAFSVSRPALAGKTAGEVEHLFPGRVVVDKIRRGDRVIDAGIHTPIESGDTLVIHGSPKWIFLGTELIGPEVDITTITDVVGEVLEVCVLNREVVGKTLAELGARREAHGIFLTKITRQGHELPITRDTVVHKCDVMQIVGPEEDVERAAKLLGYPERPTAVTDLVMMGLGIVLGTLLGLIVVHVGRTPVTLGVGGGVLISGLIFGWLRSVHPTFGQISSGAQWLLQDFGLNLFIACVGLMIGPQAVQAFETTGLSVFLAGVALCLLPLFVGMAFGKLVLKMNPVLLLGALSGARSCTAAINTIQEDAESKAPVLGYAAPYALANLLLTIWGGIIVNVMALH